MLAVFYTALVTVSGEVVNVLQTMTDERNTPNPHFRTATQGAPVFAFTAKTREEAAKQAQAESRQYRDRWPLTPEDVEMLNEELRQ